MPTLQRAGRPRYVRGIAIFLLEGLEQAGRSGTDLFVFQRARVEGQRAAQKLLGKGALLFRRQAFEGLQQGLGVTAHAPIIAWILTTTYRFTACALPPSDFSPQCPPQCLCQGKVEMS